MSSTEYRDAPFWGAASAGWRRSYSRISWGAVIAGAVVAAATMLLLSFLGVAIGAGALRLTDTGATDLRGYGLGAGIWTAVNLILAMLFGGYVAARLSGTHSHLDGELHGITVWAVATLLATVLLGQLASLAVGAASSAAGPAVTGSLTGTPATVLGGQNLVDRLQQSLSVGSDPTQMTQAQIRGEIALLTGRLLSSGSLADQDRDRLTTLVAARDNLTREEAARRVARMQENATAILAQARNAANEAAAGAALGARALFSALLLGLGAAMLGAWLGTRHARLLTPTPVPEPAYEPHAASYATRTVYEPQPVPTSVHVVEDSGRPLPAYLLNVTFPATKQELLRAARAVQSEPMALSRLERVPDRSYSSLDDLRSALMATA
jgi:Protein of unknown function (DUF2795)